MHLPMRLYHVAIDARLHDLRPAGACRRRSTTPATTAPRRPWARAARGRLGRRGLPQRAPRARPVRGPVQAARRQPCLHAAYLLYAWDGERFTDVYEKTE
jgi:hypothetical protein